MRIMMLDIDGTICDDVKNEDAHLYADAKVLPGSLEMVNKWFDDGDYICFFTAREEKDRQVTIDWLTFHGFKFHQLLMNKPRCINPDDEYIWLDNRTVRAATYKGVWSELEYKTKEVLIFKEEE